jgi:thioredoxin 1
MKSVLHATTATFDATVLQSPVPVLVDFYADWCGPCRMLAPALDRLAGEFAGRVRIVKVNVDEAPEIAARYRVSSIPALVFIANGRTAGQTAGLIPEAPLRQALEKLADAGTKRNAG